MKALVVMKRQFLGTWPLWGAAFALGVLVAASPALLSRRGWEAEMRLASAMGLGLGFSGVVGAFLGASLFGTDLAEGRLGFHLDRPLGLSALFAGRLLGSVSVAFLGAFLIQVPLLVLGPSDPWKTGMLLGAILALALFAVLAGHAVSISLRARSPWILLDGAAAAGAAGLLAWTYRALWRGGAEPLFGPFATAQGAAILLTLLLAGWLQLTRGRSSLARGHRILSFILAPGLLLTAGGGVLAARWALHPSASRILGGWVDAFQPGGPWISVIGRVKGFNDIGRGMLIHTGTGKVEIIPGNLGIFSPDGRRFLWEAFLPGRRREVEIRSADLAGEGFSDRSGGPVLPSHFSLLACSQDGSRVLVTSTFRRLPPHPMEFEVHDLKEARRIARWIGPASDTWAQVRFLGPDQVFLVLRRGPLLQAWDWDLAKPEPRLRWGRREEEARAAFRMELSPDASRLLVPLGERSGDRRWVQILEAATGREVTRHPGWKKGNGRQGLWLSDGDALVASSQDGRPRLLKVDPEGRTNASFELPDPEASRVKAYRLLGELEPGRILLMGEDAWRRGAGCLELLLRDGSLRPFEGGLATWDTVLGSLEGPDPGGAWSRLLRRPDGALQVRGADGAFRPLTAPAPPGRQL